MERDSRQIYYKYITNTSTMSSNNGEKSKGKVDHAPPERRWGAHLPLIAFEPVGG